MVEKFKNWWNKPLTNGWLCKQYVASTVVTAIMYGGLYVWAKKEKKKLDNENDEDFINAVVEEEDLD